MWGVKMWLDEDKYINPFATEMETVAGDTFSLNNVKYVAVADSPSANCSLCVFNNKITCSYAPPCKDVHFIKLEVSYEPN